MARQRIAQRLSQYQLIEKRIKGDGACQFRAIADQLFGTEQEHTRVRANVCHQVVFVEGVFVCVFTLANCLRIFINILVPLLNHQHPPLLNTQMYRFPDLYKPHVAGNYAEYCANMQYLATWGDHITLQAAADAYGVRILVLTSWRDSEVVEVVPRQQSSEKIVYLSFWGGSHYNSVYQRGIASSGARGKLLGSKTLGRLSQLLFP